MRIEVKYSGKTFGAGSNAAEYSIEISQSWFPSGVKIKFDFKSPASGQSDNWDSDAAVYGGELAMPLEQAVAMAEAILAVSKLRGVDIRVVAINKINTNFRYEYFTEPVENRASVAQCHRHG